MNAAIEHEFEVRLAEIGRECETCVRFVYTEITFHHWTSSEPELLDRVRPNAGFWNPVLAALQGAGIVALGRLYDGGRHRWSMRSFLDLTHERVGLFRRDALRARKIRLGLQEAAASEFVAGAFEVRAGGFDHLRRHFEDAAALYSRTVEPIRHSVFAHAGPKPLDERAELFAKLFVREVERVAITPLLVYQAVWQAYWNGREPQLSEVESNGALVTNAVAGGDLSSGEQYFAARKVWEFLTQLRAVPVDD